MKTRLMNREVWVWGAKTIGISVFFLLKRLYAIQPFGVIDNDPLRQKSSIEKVDIVSFEAFLAKKTPKSYVVIASSGYAAEMAALCESVGLRKDEDYFFAESILGPIYQIDVTNVCNLSCPSCPQGNYPQKRYKSIMTIELFRDIIDKAMAETPNMSAVSLFYLGENLLVKDIHLYIEELYKRNIPCFLSSNLNIRKNFETIIKQNPHYMRISTSGFYQDTYKIDHRGGDINLFKSNLYLLRYFMDQYSINSYIEIAYHSYNYNNNEEKQRMKELCEELDFSFINFNATLLGVENIINIVEGNVPQTIDPGLFTRFEFDVRQFPCVAVNDPMQCYFFKNNITITASGHVMVCCATCDTEKNHVAESCFAIDFRKIHQLKSASETCKKCLKYGIPRLYDTVVGDMDSGKAWNILHGVENRHAAVSRKDASPDALDNNTVEP